MSRILVEHDQHILTIALNRPEKRNALTNDMYEDMAVAIESVADNQNIKAILLKGVGDAFTAGNDLSQFASALDEEHLAETVHFMNALMDCPLPVVACVHGQAIGIGTTLLLHCDLVYCATNTKFCLPFINLGLVPEYASSWLLPQLVGHRKAAEWLMLGEPFGTNEALDGGLVNRVIDESDLVMYVDDILRKLVQKPRLAMQQTKALMKTNLEQVKLHMADELDVFISQLNTESAKEAFAAFLEKRLPDTQKYQ